MKKKEGYNDTIDIIERRIHNKPIETIK